MPKQNKLITPYRSPISEYRVELRFDSRAVLATLEFWMFCSNSRTYKKHTVATRQPRSSSIYTITGELAKKIELSHKRLKTRIDVDVEKARIARELAHAYSNSDLILENPWNLLACRMQD
jgi:hypothetical protein